MKITWFGHSCFRVEFGASRILIDPFLTGNPTFEKAGIREADVIDGITHVALTHGHEDHVGDTLRICKETGTTLIAVHELATYLAGHGVEKTDSGNTGGMVPQEEFALTFVQAQHSSSNMVDGRPVYLGHPCGIVIAAKGGKTLYHMGDTDVFSDMALINELHEPQIGIVPIGDRYTMGAEGAALACKRFFDFDTIIPCHYGTFPVIDQTPDKFIAAMTDHEIVVPEVGVPFEA
ncbi:MAG: metal-dependent hydrolase [Methyloceanibacter sp.]|jgi:L-ascorbate metabolism protein UlaG (beta-lactamase superfamily)